MVLLWDMTRQEVGEVIRARRKYLGHSQSVMAVKAGVALATLSKIENSKGIPDTRTLGKIAAAMGMKFVITVTPIEDVQVKP